MDDMIIKIDDVAASGHCAKGTRRFFHEHNLDFKEFMRVGIRATDLGKTQDGLALQIIEATKQRRGL